MVLLLKYLLHCQYECNIRFSAIVHWNWFIFFSWCLFFVVVVLKSKANNPGIMCIMWASLVHSLYFFLYFFLFYFFCVLLLLLLLLLLLFIFFGFGVNQKQFRFIADIYGKRVKKKVFFVSCRTNAHISYWFIGRMSLCITLAIILYMVWNTACIL